MIDTRLSIHAAMGFGRSYGKESGFMGKKFSGIFSSRLWDGYEDETCASTFAFVTDIGNDLAYEEPVARIMEWVEECVLRLYRSGAQVALTNVPLDVLRGMSRARFEFLRAVFFPRCRLDWLTLLNRAEELHDQLKALAENQKTPIFSVPNAWYGFDPIHPRACRMSDYWRAMVGLLKPSETGYQPRRRSMRHYLRLRTMSSPDVRWPTFQGRLCSCRAVLDDGSRVVLY
jgi:hypothetical protein